MPVVNMLNALVNYYCYLYLITVIFMINQQLERDAKSREAGDSSVSELKQRVAELTRDMQVHAECRDTLLLTVT
jgi:predicted mannosyl-3-phosphoglycerate phosphatase (HAD superfamily)